MPRLEVFITAEDAARLTDYEEVYGLTTVIVRVLDSDPVLEIEGEVSWLEEE